jgi:BirA family biotin operon repressor/biotin-[acetyl-CoA-carboxylase] ligase
MAPEALNLAEIRSALIGTRFAAQLHHFPSIGSTNTALLEAASPSFGPAAPEGTVYLADEQTAGRGRGGHAWHSAPGDGLYLSVLVTPVLPIANALWLSLATGLAARSAIASTCGLTPDLAPDIRWPNDLLLGTKKLGGILVETAIDPATHNLRHAVIGIGINVNHAAFPPDLVTLATSLRLATNHELSRQSLLISLLRALDHELTLLESADPTLLDRFTAASTWVRGKRVHVPEQGGYTGTTAGLDVRGFLLVDDDDGTRRTVLSGGVREI